MPLHLKSNHLHLVRTRPAAMNPYTAASARNAEVTAITAGAMTAYFGRDLDTRTALARAYIASRNTLGAKLRRILL